MLTLPIAAFFRTIYTSPSAAAQHVNYALTDLPIMLPLFALGMWAAEIQVESPGGHQGGNHSVSGFATAVNAALRQYCVVGLVAAFAIAVIFRDLLSTRYEGASQAEPAKVAIWGALFYFLLLCALYNQTARSILSWRPLVAAGGISYSLYLIHLPLIEVARVLIPPTSLPSIISIPFYYLLVPSTCVGLAWMFFRAFERPFLTPPVVLKRGAPNRT